MKCNTAESKRQRGKIPLTLDKNGAVITANDPFNLRKDAAQSKAQVFDTKTRSYLFPKDMRRERC